MTRRNSSADEIAAAMVEGLGMAREASLPVSLKWFRMELSKAEQSKDLGRLNELKGMAGKVAMNPDLAFSLAVKAIQRCSGKK